jgi:hypothetical protein
MLLFKLIIFFKLFNFVFNFYPSDIPQVIILTKIDSISDVTEDDPANAFRSQKVERCVAKVTT